MGGWDRISMVQLTVTLVAALGAGGIGCSQDDGGGAGGSTGDGAAGAGGVGGSIAPDAVTGGSIAPDAATGGSIAPDAALDGFLPDGPLPDGPLPDGPLPDGPLPDGPLPDGPLPDGPLPDGPLPDMAPPDMAPDAALPDMAPDAEAPDAAPDLGAPESIPLGAPCSRFGGLPCEADAFCPPGIDPVCAPIACGDGWTAGEEQCDDGNTDPGDLCDEHCGVERDNSAAEPDDRDHPTPLAFDASGWAAATYEIDPEGDSDWFTFQLDADTEVVIRTRNFTRDGCNGDTVVDLYRGAEPDPLASDDDGGVRLCSRLRPADDPELAPLAAGPYVIHVRRFGNRSAAWNVLEVIQIPAAAPGLGDRCDPDPDSVLPCPDAHYCPLRPAPACMAHVCGDGRLDPANEACDDGNLDPGDGCEACAIVPIDLDQLCVPGSFPCADGAYCPAGPDPVCTAHVCGDGVLDPANEICDDGNANPGDGCEACVVVPIDPGQPCVPGGFPCADGAYCPPGPDPACTNHACGDGVLNPPGGEQCDDGNLDPGDGCDPQCQREGIDVSAGGDFAGALGLGETDLYLLSLDLAAQVTLETSDGQGGCGFDTRLEVLDDTGARIAFNDDIGGGNLCSRVIEVFAAGQYSIIVDEFRQDAEIPRYTLTVTIDPVLVAGDGCDRAGAMNACGPGLFCRFQAVGDEGVGICGAPDAGPVAVDEVEPNQTSAEAGGLPLALPGAVRGAVGENDPFDVFVLDLQADAFVRAETACDGDSRLYRIDPAILDGMGVDAATAFGARLAYDDDISFQNRCSRIEQALPAGPHYFLVDEFGRNAAMSFTLSFVAVPEIALGDRCDASGVENVCAGGAACADPEGDGDGVCQ